MLNFPRSFPLLRVFLVSLGLGSALAAQTSEGTAPVFNWTTLSGRATLGHEDGPAAQARFNHPHGLARDQAGNVYVADKQNHTIRKITPEGVVSTLAGSPGLSGSADGTGGAARFDTPKGLAVDGSGNVYVADSMNYTVRKITPAGMVTTLAGQPGKLGYADGPAGSARFNFVAQIAADSAGNVFVADHGIRRISAGRSRPCTPAAPSRTRMAGLSPSNRGDSLAVTLGRTGLQRRAGDAVVRPGTVHHPDRRHGHRHVPAAAGNLRFRRCRHAHRPDRGAGSGRRGRLLLFLFPAGLLRP
ncbi:MAG: hypothetical protein WDM96_09250 [Lacunisphaera sp.]